MPLLGTNGPTGIPGSLGVIDTSIIKTVSIRCLKNIEERTILFPVRRVNTRSFIRGKHRWRKKSNRMMIQTRPTISQGVRRRKRLGQRKLPRRWGDDNRGTLLSNKPFYSEKNPRQISLKHLCQRLRRRNLYSAWSHPLNLKSLSKVSGQFEKGKISHLVGQGRLQVESRTTAFPLFQHRKIRSKCQELKRRPSENGLSQSLTFQSKLRENSILSYWT